MAHPTAAHSLRLHRFLLSGHCHRVELLLALLQLPFEAVDVDLQHQEQKTPRFLALNAFGQVPVLEDGALVIADSNAILLYLASAYGGERFQLRSPALLAEQQRWFSVAAGPLAAGPASARVQCLWRRGTPASLEEARAKAHALLRVMDGHLSSRRFLLGEQLSLADVANYSYVAHAPEGGVALTEYPHVRAWVAQVEATPGFVAMPKSPPPQRES
jgi:glutathione S-transferase